MSVCVVVPTRGRPGAARELAQAFRDTCVKDDTHLVFAVDDDDPELEAYGDGKSYRWRHTIVTVGPRLRMGPTLNKIAREYAYSHDVIGFMGDDHRPRTHGWDSQVWLSQIATPGVVYGDDLIQHDALPTAAFVHSDFVLRLGYMAPPKLVHLYLDNFWLDLGRATNLSYRPDLVFEHLHPIAGKAEWDAGYSEANSDATSRHDAEEYQRYIREDWPTELTKLHQ